MGNVIPCFVLKWENLFPIEIGPNKCLLIPIVSETGTFFGNSSIKIGQFEEKFSHFNRKQCV